MAGKVLPLALAKWLLPRDFRERVFEPALADLRIEEAELSRRRWLARVVLCAECVRLMLPSLVWQRRRLTKVGAAMLVGLLIAIIVLQRLSYAAGGRH
jgi:hypothetical protein